MSDLQDVVDVLFLHFTDSTAGKGRAFSYVFFLWGLFTPPPPYPVFFPDLGSDVSSDPLNDGIWELNCMPCFSFVPPILSRCFQELMSLLSYL